MTQYKKITAFTLAATTAAVMTMSFHSEAAEYSKYVIGMSQEKQVIAPEDVPVQSFSEWFQSAPEGAALEAKETAVLAQEEYEKQQEEERKRQKAERIAAEEARRAEEEAARAEAERIAAEEAAAAQAAVQVNPDEQALLAALIFCEAGNQPYEGQVAVGAVVMNRVRSGAFPNSISEVVYQSGQFSPAMSGWLDGVLANGSYTDSAMQAAADALAGSNPIGEYLYFDCGGVGYQLGDHYFH